MDNAQCQVSSRNWVSARDFHLGRVSNSSRCKHWFRSCGRAAKNFVRVSVSLSLPLLSLQSRWANLEKPSTVETFNPPSYVLQYVPHLSRFHPQLSSRLERNNLKLLDIFLFTPTLLNARIKVCYCKNVISASSRADSDIRVALNFLPQSAELLN